MTSSFDIFISGFSRHPRGLFLANKIKAKFLLIAVAVPKASLVAVQAVAANTISKRRGLLSFYVHAVAIPQGLYYSSYSIIMSVGKTPVVKKKRGGRGPGRKNKPQRQFCKGRWTCQEKLLFLVGLRKYGKGKWKEIAKILTTR
jgi:hypothetical protein